VHGRSTPPASFAASSRRRHAQFCTMSGVGLPVLLFSWVPTATTFPSLRAVTAKPRFPLQTDGLGTRLKSVDVAAVAAEAAEIRARRIVRVPGLLDDGRAMVAQRFALETHRRRVQELTRFQLIDRRGD
jgi:hypothetical protein